MHMAKRTPWGLIAMNLVFAFSISGCLRGPTGIGKVQVQLKRLYATPFLGSASSMVAKNEKSKIGKSVIAGKARSIASSADWQSFVPEKIRVPFFEIGIAAENGSNP